MRTGASIGALIAGLLLLAGCGPKAITVGSRPFPTKHPVFSDASGKAIEALPEVDGTIRLVFLEFPWCTACADVWRAMRTAAARKGESGFLSLWAGQGIARARALPAGELVRRLVEEMKEASR